MSKPKSKFKLSEPLLAFQCSIFRIWQREATRPDNDKMTLPIFTLQCTDWVNIIPFTASGHVVLVEQHRFGSDSFTLETPGGAVEKEEKDYTMAALRELEEETGLTSQRILALPGFHANPAMQNNKVTFFIAFDAQPSENRKHNQDPFEDIHLHCIPYLEALQMVRTGQISHSLAALGLLLAEPYYRTKFGA